MEEKSGAQKAAEGLQEAGNNLMGCGCLVVVLAVILFLLFAVVGC